MTSITIFTNLLAILFACFTLAGASPMAAPRSVQARDIFDPKVLYPHAGTVWKIFEHHNVTWDTSNAPVDITNETGMILLRVFGFEMPLILAQGFNILDGRVEVQVPWLLPRSDYSIVLFGDSGNFGQNFTITD